MFCKFDCESSIAQVGLRFDLVQKSCSTIAELHCASTQFKSLLCRMLRCNSEKKLNQVSCAALLVIEKIVKLNVISANLWQTACILLAV